MEPAKFNELNALTEKIIGAAIDVHKELGPGLLESIYEVCLIEELERKGLCVQHQVDFPVYYKGKLTDKHLRMDIVVEDKIVIELKAVEKILPVHEVQLVTYLKLTNKNIGLLINFNVAHLKDGIKRKIYERL